MNVLQFKEWLNQFDDDVIVEVLVQEEPDTYQAYGACGGNEFTGGEFEDYDYVDFAKNKYLCSAHPCFNKKILTLGVST